MRANRRDWQRLARCKSLTIEQSKKLFFLGQGNRANAAKDFCNLCPVKRECLNFAILYDEKGVWGGTIDDERKVLKKYLYESLYRTAEADGSLETRDPNEWLPKVDPLDVDRLIPGQRLSTEDLTNNVNSFLGDDQRLVS